MFQENAPQNKPPQTPHPPQKKKNLGIWEESLKWKTVEGKGRCTAKAWSLRRGREGVCKYGNSIGAPR